MLKLRDFWRGAAGEPMMAFNAQALRILAQLLVITAGLSVVFLFGPLLLSEGAGRRVVGRRWFLGYFACLGLGFVLIELPLMQRFVLFLGHPTYALAVVLASLLVFGGVGAFVAGRMVGHRCRSALLLVLGALLVVTVIYRIGLPGALGALSGLSTPMKVLVTGLLLLPLGSLLGVPLPLALRHLSTLPGGAALVPWAWAVNGALSVFATVLSTLAAVGFGFSSALFIGQLAYAGAFALVLAFPSADSPP